MGTIVVRDILIPPDYAKLSNWGPQFNTTVITQKGGYVDTQENWPFALWSGTVSYFRTAIQTGNGIQADQRIDKAYRFFLNSRGMGRGFLVQDPTDCKDWHSGGTGIVTQVDGVYRLVKNYYDGVDNYQRLITRPQNDVVLGGGASAGTVGDLGVVTGISSDGTWTGTFNVPMRMAVDGMNQNFVAADTVSLDITLIEIREV